jgi:hypothetical protein
MKKTIYSLSFFIVVGILLSSCSTQLSTLSITKRHYRNGYHIDFAQAKRKAESDTHRAKSTLAPLAKEVALRESKEKTIQTITVVESTTSSMEDVKSESKEITASTTKPHFVKIRSVKPSLSVEEVKTILDRNEKVKAVNLNKGGGNSNLVWTIIAILLILILLSLLTGGWLGGLLYLVLVVLVVLLLLKLLGII